MKNEEMIRFYHFIVGRFKHALTDKISAHIQYTKATAYNKCRQDFTFVLIKPAI